MARPSARWTGTVNFPELDRAVEGGLYSSQCQSPRKLTFIQIHTQCRTRLKGSEEGAGNDKKKKGKDQLPVQTTREVTCPSCNKAIPKEEIGSAVDTEMGFLLVTDQERAALKIGMVKKVDVGLRINPEKTLAAISTGRRLYFLPKHSSVDTYYAVLRTLLETNRVGFIPEIVIDKGTYVMLIRPIVAPASIFGQATALLVADEFVDTDTLIDPRDLQLLPENPPDIAVGELNDLCEKANAIQTSIRTDECKNPSRVRFDQLVARKLTEEKRAAATLS